MAKMRNCDHGGKCDEWVCFRNQGCELSAQGFLAPAAHAPLGQEWVTKVTQDTRDDVPLMGSPAAHAERPDIPAEVVKLIQDKHWEAVGSNALFSVEHWKHNAGPEWPHEPDDDSYLAFDNCIHPTCKWARAALSERAPETPR